MLYSLDDDEFDPDLSILVATAGILEQPAEIASGMDDNVGLYSTSSGKFFLTYESAEPAMDTSQDARADTRIWPVVTDEDWEEFLREDLSRYCWTVVDRSEFQAVRERADALPVVVKEASRPFSPDAVSALKRMKDGNITPTNVVWSLLRHGRITHLIPQAEQASWATDVLMLPVTRSVRREVDLQAREAGLTQTQFLNWCVQQGLRSFSDSQNKK